MQVSVICPVFNTRPGDLREAVSSVLGQGDHLVQLILIDDCSTDSSTASALEHLRALGDSRLLFLRTTRNSGPAVSRNLGLEHATCEWIGFIDSDDVWPGGKLSTAAAVVGISPEAQWIVGDIAILGPDAVDPARPGSPCLKEVAGPDLAVATPALTRGIITDGLHLGTCLVRRAAVGDLRFNPHAGYGEDLLFLAKLSLSVPAFYASGLSYLFRRGHVSMMYSPGRLSARYASGPRAGYADPALRSFRREYRWALYGLYKGLALNNLLNCRPLFGLRFALSALRIDPREVKDFVRFLGLMRLRDRSVLAEQARSYTGQEQVVLPDTRSGF